MRQTILTDLARRIAVADEVEHLNRLWMRPTIVDRDTIARARKAAEDRMIALDQAGIAMWGLDLWGDALDQAA